MQPNQYEFFQIFRVINSSLQRLPQKPRGIVLPMVLVFSCILGVLVFSFTNFATHSARTAFQSEKEEIGKRILESALDEAFFIVQNKTQNRTDALSQALIDKNNNTGTALDLASLPRTKSLIVEMAKVNPFSAPVVKVTISKRDFRGGRAPKGQVYFGNEGHGTLVLTGEITIGHGSVAMQSFIIERHHDYKVLNLVSGQTLPGRATNAENVCLDYIMYVKDGYNEFQTSSGKMLNNSNLKLSIKPNGHGKIYFGGADNPDTFVFLNIAETLAAKIPPVTNPTDNFSASEKGQMADEILADPEAKKAIVDKAKEENPGVPDSMIESEVDTQVKNEANSSSLTLEKKNIPFSSTPDEKEQKIKETLFNPSPSQPQENGQPGIELLPPTEAPHQLIEGHVRQRFIQQVETKGGLITRVLSLVSKNFLLSFDPEMYKKNSKDSTIVKKIVTRIYKFIQKLRGTSTTDAFTKTDEELPYGSNSPTDRKKAYNSAAVPVTHTPFSYTNLRSYSASNLDDLKNLGFLSGNTLKINGALHVRSSITLGEGGPLTVSGNGVLSTNGNITIKNAIACDGPQSLLILNSSGDIIISTTAKIEAGIIARSVIVTSGGGFNLKGALYVDNLGSANWPVGPHVLEYDDARFFSPSASRDTISVSPRLTFIRLIRKE